MKKKLTLLILAALAICALTACGAKKEVVGSWHFVKQSGMTLSEYSEQLGIPQILLETTFIFNEDGSFESESGASIAAGEAKSTGTWEYENNSYIITMSDGTQYSAAYNDSTITITASDGTIILEPGAAEIDKAKAAAAYEEVLNSSAEEPEEPVKTVDADSDEQTDDADDSSKTDSVASPDAIDKTKPADEEENEPSTPISMTPKDIYANITNKIWVDSLDNYYEFYDDKTCYVKYSDGSELTGEYQVIKEDGKILFDLILNESELIRTLTEIKEDCVLFEDGFKLTISEG